MCSSCRAAHSTARRRQSTPGYPTSRLFRNDLTRGPDGKPRLHFTDVTAQAGVGLRAYGMGVAVGDYDNDGDLDLFVTSVRSGDAVSKQRQRHIYGRDEGCRRQRSALEHERRRSSTTTVTAISTSSSRTISTSRSPETRQCTDAAGAPDYCGPRTYRPVPDRLYRNDGNGHFTDVTESAGIARADGAGLGVVADDFNGDGWLDLYVANDATPNQLWINQQDGTFVDEGPLSGAALNAAGNPEGQHGDRGSAISMGTATRISSSRTSSARPSCSTGTTGRAISRMRASPTGIAALTTSVTGFGTDWFDYDNDGWLDLFVANGAVNVIESQRGQPNPFRMKNQLFHNSGTGRLTDASAAGGPAFDRAEISRGAAFGDIDNDGDTDIVVTTNGGPVRLLLNQGTPGNHWIDLALQDSPGNRFGLGARVGIERAGKPTLWRRVHTDGSYLSASDIRAHVGLGPATGIGSVIVQWVDGTRERWTNVAADTLTTLRRGTGQKP